MSQPGWKEPSTAADAAPPVGIVASGKSDETDPTLRTIHIPAHFRLSWFEEGTNLIAILKQVLKIADPTPLDPQAKALPSDPQNSQIWYSTEAGMTMNCDTWEPVEDASPTWPNANAFRTMVPLMLTVLQSLTGKSILSKSKECWFACPMPHGVHLEQIDIAVRKLEFSQDLFVDVLQAGWPHADAHGLNWLATAKIDGTGFKSAFKPKNPNADFRTQIAHWKIAPAIYVDQEAPLLIRLSGPIGPLDGIAKIGILGLRLTYRLSA